MPQCSSARSRWAWVPARSLRRIRRDADIRPWRFSRFSSAGGRGGLLRVPPMSSFRVPGAVLLLSVLFAVDRVAELRPEGCLDMGRLLCDQFVGRSEDMTFE